MDRGGATVEATVQSLETIRTNLTTFGQVANHIAQATEEQSRTGEEAAIAHDDDLDAYMHLAMCNRGILMTPFHNMALMSSSHVAADVDLHTELFAAGVDEILG